MPVDHVRAAFAAYVREHKQLLTTEYAAEAREATAHQHGMDLTVLVDHFPEFLHAFADWLDGSDAAATRYVAALAEGHAVQRLGLGYDLAALVAEYATMRRVVLRHLLGVASGPQATNALLLVDEGLDRAIHEAVRTYTATRDRLRDRFLGMLGHDLRSPLQSALLSARLVERGGLTPPQVAASMARIARAVERVNAMIGDLLDFARTQLGGAMPVHPAHADMGDVCASLVEEFRPVAQERVLHLECRGDLRCVVDAARVAQALGNLVGNALKHGTGDVHVRAWEEDGGRAVHTSVSNAGEIPAARRAWLFDPYVRGADEHRRGLGLGLFIVQQVALAHGATCDVTSSEEEGTTISVRWPRTPTDEVRER